MKQLEKLAGALCTVDLMEKQALRAWDGHFQNALEDFYTSPDDASRQVSGRRLDNLTSPASNPSGFRATGMDFGPKSEMGVMLEPNKTYGRGGRPFNYSGFYRNQMDPSFRNSGPSIPQSSRLQQLVAANKQRLAAPTVPLKPDWMSAPPPTVPLKPDAPMPLALRTEAGLQLAQQGGGLQLAQQGGGRPALGEPAMRQAKGRVVEKAAPAVASYGATAAETGAKNVASAAGAAGSKGLRGMAEKALARMGPRGRMIAGGLTGAGLVYGSNRMGHSSGMQQGYGQGQMDLFNKYKQNTSGFGGTLKGIGNQLGLVSDRTIFS